MISIIMIVIHLIKKIWNYGNNLMNLLHNFGAAFVILLFKSLKMKLIGNFSKKGFSIFFTYLKIHMSWNHLNPSQHTSVLDLPNLRWTTLLLEVTPHPLLIKHLYLHRTCGRSFEPICWIITSSHHILPPHLLWTYAQICIATLMVVTRSCLLNLRPLVIYCWMLFLLC